MAKTPVDTSVAATPDPTAAIVRLTEGDIPPCNIETFKTYRQGSLRETMLKVGALIDQVKALTAALAKMNGIAR